MMCFVFKSEYNPSTFRTKIESLGRKTFAKTLIILSPDKMYDFFCPYHNASPNVTGMRPDSAIFFISFILVMIGLLPVIKSVGGRQYGFNLFFIRESSIIL